ncbi:MAG: hypothetical protein ACK5LV_09990 [Lachnospirales bacterium]
MMAQEELVKRRVVHISKNGKKRNFSSNHCFSQIVFWRCLSRLESTGIKEPCNARTVNEAILEEIYLKAINQIFVNKDNFIKTLQENIVEAVKLSDVTSIEGIDEKLDTLQQKLVNKVHDKKAYAKIANEILHLRELKTKAESDTLVRNDKITRIHDL